MTGLLVSVRNVTEAQVALAGGADIIDVKEPSRGALGPADPSVWREIVAEIAGRAPVSAALGELATEAIERLAAAAAGLAFVKIGLAGCSSDGHWQARWWQSIERLPASALAVPVAYADWQQAGAPPPEEALALAGQLPYALQIGGNPFRLPVLERARGTCAGGRANERAPRAGRFPPVGGYRAAPRPGTGLHRSPRSGLQWRARRSD
jgi:hypothetical protein